MSEKVPQAGEQAVLVTTAHRGVFFGYAVDVNGDTIHLRRGRNCISWTADLRGFAGLAAFGPTRECKIGPAIDMILRDITAVLKCTDAAAARWEAAD